LATAYYGAPAAAIIAGLIATESANEPHVYTADIAAAILASRRASAV